LVHPVGRQDDVTGSIPTNRASCQDTLCFLHHSSASPCIPVYYFLLQTSRFMFSARMSVLLTQMFLRTFERVSVPTPFVRGTGNESKTLCRHSIGHTDKNKFWEELIVCFPLTRNGVHSKRGINNSYIVVCVSVAEVKFLPSRCLAKHTRTD
jgi:hypothetical protein